jgi:eukaryotic-like serine/threonine-protein kinase
MTEGSTRADPASHAATPTEWPVVPGYEILGELGRGGMGVVYKARQVSLKRLVALKVIRDGAMAGSQTRSRFRIEAEAAARLSHPNVVRVYEAGNDHGRLYFAMELVEGDSLDKYLAGKPQPAQQGAELIRTLALAVQHAHAQQVVHRDLKPANVLLTSPSPPGPLSHAGERGSQSSPPSPLVGEGVKITDFGLAKRLDGDSTVGTQDGAFLGTASYVAPEQAAGRVCEIGPAADVYSLGAILYECLTGRPPFLGDTWNQTVDQVLHEEPVPPSRLSPSVPPALETVCLKCLEKEPGRRYASAEELADDLARFLEGQPVAAVPLGERERLARLAARDGYQIVGEIGRGLRATVYRALHGPLKQPTALKVFTAQTCTREEWEARLRRGAELWVSLAHPHVVAVQRAGWWDGQAYAATECVPQGSLAERIAAQRYPVREALRLVEQLAEVVSYLHRQGVVHGNLKPSNVLLAADGIPRLVDFRLTGALFLGPPPTDEQEPAGLGYLTPEQVRNWGAEPRPYTDVYGLGLILYELLTGRPPFGGATARETLDLVVTQQPVPPSRLNSQTSPELDALCLRCLDKNPWQRYHRAYDLVSRLRHFQNNPRGRAVPGERPWRAPAGDAAGSA